MEPNVSHSCAICADPVYEDKLSFICGHVFCLKCFSFLLYNKLETTGIRDSFFERTAHCQCIICHKGTSKIPFDELKKMFQNSSIFKPESKVLKTIFLCSCSNKEKLAFFCYDCRLSFCESCSKTDHKSHKQTPLGGMDINFDRIVAKKFLSDILQAFSEQKSEIFYDINGKIEYIIEESKTSDYKTKLSHEYQSFHEALTMIETSILLLNEELLENNEAIHPNKLFHLNQFFSSFYKKNLKMNRFQVKIDEISGNLTFTAIDNKGYLKINKNIDSLSRLSKKLELFEKQPLILETDSFNPGQWWKSQTAVSFTIKDEGFLAWPGKKDGIGCLHIFNLSSRKKEAILQGGNSDYGMLGIYPKEGISMWLYSGDCKGIFRVYDLKEDKNFKEVYKIETNLDKWILSAVVFNDKFNEITDGKNGEKHYVAMSFYCNQENIRIYRLTEGGGELIKEIENQNNKICSPINFFHNESISKTSLFFGFATSFIKIYDLKTDNWLTQQFETKYVVTSMNFVVNDEKIGNLLIYTHKNWISLANINSGNIIREIDLLHIGEITDLCLWDCEKKYLIVLGEDCQKKKNFMEFISFEEFAILKSIELGSSSYYTPSPVNLTKILIKLEKSEDVKECMAVCHRYGNKKIVLYE